MPRSQQVRHDQEITTSLDEAVQTDLSVAQRMLLDFLREHDAECPVCGYNVRGLTRPICPECKQELSIAVGAARLQLGWLMAAAAPGFFSGIAACFLLIPILGRAIFGDGRMSMTLNVVDLFGWCSGIFAILLARKRVRFLTLPRAKQRWFAIIVWAVHILAFVLLLLIGPMFI